jgi:hypothetical protein
VSTAAGSPADRLSTLPAGVPELTLGYEAIDWAEQWLIQPNGPNAGQPFRFTRGQGRFLLWWYGLDDDGHWLFHHAARRLAKGSGKSPFAAVLALIEFLAPVRLHDLDAKWPGGCVGKPVEMPLVQIAATAESQTANTMRMVRAFAPKRSKLVEAYALDPGKTRYYRLPEGTLEVITSSFTAAEGAESSHVVEDETEHWRPANGGVELASTIDDNLAKSGSRSIETSNAWVPGIECVAESTYDAWLAQEEGRVRGTGRILYDAVIAAPTTDLADPDSLRSALEWVYADCPWQDVHPIIERIWSPNSRPDESKRKYLNWPTTSDDAWTTPEEWAALTDATRVVADREQILLFFDGSKSGDSTVLLGCCLSDGHVFTIDVWEPEKGQEVPAADVDLAVAETFEKYRPIGFFGDVREWESFVKISWPEQFADRLQIMAVPAGKSPESIAWDMRGHVFDFTKACELVEAEIREGGFTHDGDSRLARHVGNARRKPNRYGTSIGKESPDSPRKIDGAVCVVGVRMVRRLAIAAGVGKKKRSGIVW